MAAIMYALWPIRYQHAVPLEFHVIERRRTIAEGCVALGLIGSRAIHANDAATAVAATRTLCSIASEVEPGVQWAAFMTRASVTHNAALGECARL
jgi:hypothetical protein